MGFDDLFQPRPVLESTVAYHGLIWDIAADRVDLGGGTVVTREYVKHTGAVGILALDEDDRVLLVRQYRHPVGYDLVELPAGLLDQPGEPAVEAAKRELAEEADLFADHWQVLIDWFNSPGGSDEAIRVFLARGLHDVPVAERHTRTDEEASIMTAWVSLEEAHQAVLTGRVHNPTAVVGILAAYAARVQGWTTLRPADAPWPQHKGYR